MNKFHVGAIVFFLVAYFLGVFFPGPGQKAASTVTGLVG